MNSVNSVLNKIFQKAVLVFCIGISFLSSLSYAQKGTVGGGGLDAKDKYEGTTWFVDRNKVIKTCFVKDPSFKISDQELKNTFLSSVSIWKDYYLKLRREVRHDDQQGKDGLLSFNFSISTNCTGGEDLTVYFGTTSREVEFEKLRYNNPISLVKRTAYNKSIGWSKGFIWLSKDLINIPNFSARLVKSVLLHELGHVFGCGHVAGTIMDENFTNEILNPKKYINGNDSQFSYGFPSDSLDGENQLYPLSGTIRGKTPTSFCTNILGFSCYSQENHFGLDSNVEVGNDSIQVKIVFEGKNYAFNITEIEDILKTDENVFGGGVLNLHKGNFIFYTETLGSKITSGKFSGFYAGSLFELYEGGLTKIQKGILNLGPLGSIPVNILRNLKGGKIRIDYRHLRRTHTLFADTYYTK